MLDLDVMAEGLAKALADLVHLGLPSGGMGEGLKQEDAKRVAALNTLVQLALGPGGSFLGSAWVVVLRTLSSLQAAQVGPLEWHEWQGWDRAGVAAAHASLTLLDAHAWSHTKKEVCKPHTWPGPVPWHCMSCTVSVLGVGGGLGINSMSHKCWVQPCQSLTRISAHQDTSLSVPHSMCVLHRKLPQDAEPLQPGWILLWPIPPTAALPKPTAIRRHPCLRARLPWSPPPSPQTPGGLGEASASPRGTSPGASRRGEPSRSCCPGSGCPALKKLQMARYVFVGSWLLQGLTALGVWGLGFRVWGLELSVEALGMRSHRRGSSMLCWTHRHENGLSCCTDRYGTGSPPGKVWSMHT